MKILITGNRGFVGSATQLLLESEGHEVVGYDLMDGFDIRDHPQFDEVVAMEKPNRILHLAAIARFSEADKDPKLAFETNVDGTRNVADAAAAHHIPIVYASTGSVYMPIEREGAIVEDWQARGNSVYGCTKFAGETYIREANPSIILRYAHLYGREKRMHGLVGGFVERIKRGIAPVLYGGKQSNDFTYIKDVARANVLALTAPWDKWNQAYNIGTGEELTAEDAGRIICQSFEWPEDQIDIVPQRTVDPQRFWFDCSKAERMLGFKAEYGFARGLGDMLCGGDPEEMQTGKRYQPQLSNIHASAKIGKDCTVHSHAWIGEDVVIGDRVKVQAFSFIPPGVTIEDDVFVGPRVTFTNDKYPPSNGWRKTHVKRGASLGASVTVLPGVTIGEGARVGAGAVVTKDVADGVSVTGVPAREVQKAKVLPLVAAGS
jgi:UDP-2-acetamido-3-amino-2,3-dideoxy-glucuronate N-acetyltransferase